MRLRRLVADFYHIMEADPAAKDCLLTHRLEEGKVPQDVQEKLFEFLSGWMGGPKLYHEAYGTINIPRDHSHLEVGPQERDAWLLCMERALELQEYHPDFKHYLLQQLRIPAERIFAVSKKPPLQ